MSEGSFCILYARRPRIRRMRGMCVEDKGVGVFGEGRGRRCYNKYLVDITRGSDRFNYYFTFLHTANPARP
jgi:hypothetical protein